MGQGWYGAIGKLAIAALLIGAVLIWRAEAWLHVDVPLEHADVIVVLGGESGQRVIGAADRNVRGTFYALGAHLVTLEPNVLPFRQVRGWFLPPEADGEYAVGHGPGPVYALEQLSIPAGVAEKGHAYYMENRVIYLSVDGTAGHAIVSGSVPYEITFTYADGSVSALTCGCYETGLCKHGAALLLQLRETLEKIHEHWPDALAEDGYFAAVSKSAFSFFTTSSSKPASITLT